MNQRPAPSLEHQVETLYRNRFPEQQLATRMAVWSVICRHWLSRFVPADSRVLEVAPGYCEFLNNVVARQRVGIDLNPATTARAAPGVVIHQASATRIAEIFAPASFEVAFASNFFEHCSSRDQVLDILGQVHDVLTPGGAFLILGPNFSACYRTYFDFFDHHLALTDRAMVEALELRGFRIEAAWARTLPFSFQGLLPTWPWLVAVYLHCPWAWRLVGKQFFIVARRPG